MLTRSRLFSIAGLIGIFAVSSLLLAVLVHSRAHAAECGGTETAIIECDGKVSGDTQDSGIWSLLLIAINILTAGVGVLAVGGLVYAAILYTTAEDKADQLNQAKTIILNTCIGLVAFGLMYSLLQFLVPGGVFNSISAPRVSVSRQNDFNPGSTSTGGSGNNSPSNSPTGPTGDGSIATSDIKTVKNLRDAAASSGVLKPNVLYRSAQLSKLTTPNSKKLGQLLGSGSTIIDLRPPGGDTEPDKSVPGAQNINVPIQGILDTSPMVNDSTRAAQVGKALKRAANASGTVLIHCVAGKDRTGWLVAMIMYANGASDKQVMDEYLLSNQAIPGGVKPAWLTNGVQAARSKHGSVIKYLKSIGLSNADLNKLKTKFGK